MPEETVEETVQRQMAAQGDRFSDDPAVLARRRDAVVETLRTAPLTLERLSAIEVVVRTYAEIGRREEAGH